jgi:hypothetical protein
MTDARGVVTLFPVSMRTGLLAALLLVGGAACGGDGGGPPPPTVHTLVPNDASMINPADMIAYGPFTLPVDAPLNYAITDNPTGASDDTFKVTIADDASFQSGAPVPVATTVVTGDASGMTQVLPAGSYDLIIVCVDAVDYCRFSVNLTATY